MCLWAEESYTNREILSVQLELLLVSTICKDDCRLERKLPEPTFQDLFESSHSPVGSNFRSTDGDIEDLGDLFVLKALIFGEENHLFLFRR